MTTRPSLNINSLHQVHDNRLSVKINTFNKILEMCHRKIEKFNKDYKKMDCTYVPPISVIGCPLYKSEEIIRYIIENLREDGFTAFWDTTSKSIYISWFKQPSLHNDELLTEGTDDQSSMKIIQVLQSESEQDSDSTKKKSKTKKVKKQLQHVALVNYGGDANEIIPISL